ncbi:oligosaccharide flippase family protein [Photobacterium damselae]|uniref:oligosaccharide flippase family protein n=1 Tax=Photobacterium damselae TaxID=38293 RepID=UPI00165EABE9|nr:lipopolysaccharide biosynthesis protein [Photobacterium damselae]
MNIKKIIQFAIGLIGSAIVNLITLPIMTWYLPQEIIGKLSLLTVITGFVVTIFSLGLDQAYIREYHYKSNKVKLFYSTFVPGLVFLLTISIIIIILRSQFSTYINYELNGYFYFIIIAIFAFSLLNRFLSLIFRMEEKGILYSLSLAIPKLMFLILIYTYIKNFNVDFFDLITLQLFSISIMTMLSVLLLRKSIAPVDISKATVILSYFKYSFPLMFGSIAYWGLISIDRLFIAKLSDYNELAIFSIAMSFAGAANLIQSIFSTIWVPTVYKWAKEINNIAICKRKIENVNIVTCIITVIVTSFSCGFSWVVDYLIPLDYTTVKYVIPCCMIPSLYYVVSETTVTGINISKKTRYSMLSSFIALGINIIGNYMLIPKVGFTGAAISTSVSFYIFLILRTEFSVRLWIKIERLRMYIVLTVNIITAIIFSIYRNENITYFFIILNLIICYMIYRKDIKSMLSVLVLKMEHAK